MMATHYRAFKQEHSEAMLKDADLIDKYWDDYCDTACDEGAGDVITSILKEVKFWSGYDCSEVVDEMGATLQSPEHIKSILDSYEQLNLSNEEIVERLNNLEDAYHIESYQEEPEFLIEELEALMSFYKKAHDNNWGIIYYYG